MTDTTPSPAHAWAGYRRAPGRNAAWVLVARAPTEREAWRLLLQALEHVPGRGQN